MGVLINLVLILAEFWSKTEIFSASQLLTGYLLVPD